MLIADMISRGVCITSYPFGLARSIMMYTMSDSSAIIQAVSDGGTLY